MPIFTLNIEELDSKDLVLLKRQFDDEYYKRRDALKKKLTDQLYKAFQDLVNHGFHGRIEQGKKFVEFYGSDLSEIKIKIV